MSDGAFLIIGHAGDSCCTGVAAAFRQLGHDVIRTTDPLTDPFTLQWRIGLDPSSDTNAWGDAKGNPDRARRKLQGVLVRGPGGPVRSEEWDTKDFEYVRVESQAALIAWLWSLECPVVNRPSADVWVRPYRSYPEWRQTFAESGLPTASICISNDPVAARAWSRSWAEGVTYAPLTSAQRYHVSEASHWDELSKVMERTPVCLLAPTVRRSP